MAGVLVLGGGICGLASALLLAREGLDVTVLERDTAGPPPSDDAAWDAWERSGVPQFRQPHFMQPRFRHVLDADLPDVRDRLVAAGANAFDPIAALPPTIEDRDPKPGDERFLTLTARRPVLERAFADAADAEPGVTVRRGVTVRGLVGGASAVDGVPNVVGVTTDDGALEADLVVDAMGRRSGVAEWISSVGGRRPAEESIECGFTYYSRMYRSRDGSVPNLRTAFLTPYGTVSILTLPGDNLTWSVVVYSSTGDTPLKRLREAERWERVVAEAPLQSHWLDGEPLTDVMPMSGILDRRRRYVIDGAPVVTGLLPVADAWACTNPSLGRGVALGMWHASRLRDVVGAHDGGPLDLARTWDAVTEAELVPYFRLQMDIDRARLAEIEALREGRDVPADPGAEMQAAIGAATMYDGDVFRAFAEIGSCLATPEEVFSRPGLLDRALAVGGERGSPTAPEGPSRERLLEILA